MSYSCRSWRHLFPTAGRQMEMTTDNINNMGHWAKGSSTSEVYDSTACVSELRQKARVRDAFSKGWHMVEPGCIPKPLPISGRPPALPYAKRPRLCARGAAATTLVVHMKHERAHIYRDGVYTLCDCWR